MSLFRRAGKEIALHRVIVSTDLLNEVQPLTHSESELETIRKALRRLEAFANYRDERILLKVEPIDGRLSYQIDLHMLKEVVKKSRSSLKMKTIAIQESSAKRMNVLRKRLVLNSETALIETALAFCKILGEESEKRSQFFLVDGMEKTPVIVKFGSEKWPNLLERIPYFGPRIRSLWERYSPT